MDSAASAYSFVFLAGLLNEREVNLPEKQQGRDFHPELASHKKNTSLFILHTKLALCSFWLCWFCWLDFSYEIPLLVHIYTEICVLSLDTK